MSVHKLEPIMYNLLYIFNLSCLSVFKCPNSQVEFMAGQIVKFCIEKMSSFKFFVNSQKILNFNISMYKMTT